jgi:hypothetical protein
MAVVGAAIGERKATTTFERNGGVREALNREFDRMARVPSPAGVGSLAAVTAISRRDAWAVGGNAAGTLVEHHH